MKAKQQEKAKKQKNIDKKLEKSLESEIDKPWAHGEILKQQIIVILIQDLT